MRYNLFIFILLGLSYGMEPTQDLEGRTDLHKAVRAGYFKVVALLLASKALVDIQDTKGNTPLACAAYWGHTEIAQLLLENQAHCNTSNRHGKTPVYLAIDQNHEDIVKLLFDWHADITHKSLNTSSLQKAVRNNNVALVALLIKNKAPFDALFSRDVFYAKSNPHKLSPLHFAVTESKDRALVKVLLQNIAYFDLKDINCYMFFIAAIKSSTLAIVEILLDHLASVDVKGPSDLTLFIIAVCLLQKAVRRGHLAEIKARRLIVELILSRKAVIPPFLVEYVPVMHARLNQDKLIQAVNSGNCNEVATLLSHGVYCNNEAKDFINNQRKEFFKAIEDDEIDKVLEYLKHMFTIRIGDNQGNTLLHRAMASGSVQTVAILMNLLANAQVLSIYVDKKNKLGKAPLELAVGNGHFVLLNMFLDLAYTNNSN